MRKRLPDKESGQMIGGVPAAQPQQTVIGIDLSLTATGICDAYGTPRVITSKLRGVDRLNDLRDKVVYSSISEDDLVILEGYSYASHNQAHQLGELGGVIRLALRDINAPYVDVPPSTLKKFATGKGNANKAAMGLAAARCGYDGPGDDNAIDAWWLRQMGEYQFGDRFVDITNYRDEAVDKIQWSAA